MSDPFGSARAPGASGPSMAQLEGRLILIDVTSIERGITTPSGVADGVKCNLIDVASGAMSPGAMLWGKVLVNQIEAGTKYVGRIVKGVAQPGKSAPWEWQDGDEADRSSALPLLSRLAGVAAAAPTSSTDASATSSASSEAAQPPW